MPTTPANRCAYSPGRAFALAFGLLVFLIGSTAHAQTPPEIPDTLKPWTSWAMHNHTNSICAQTSPGNFECVWPGVLEIRADDELASFSLTVWMDQKGFVQLPGNKDFWPQQVQSTDTPLVVLSDANQNPRVFLDKGKHKIEGIFAWDRAPEVFAIPPESGSVVLWWKDREVVHPRVDRNNNLWLQGNEGRQKEDAETDSLRISVHRKIEDGVPIKITNRFELNVSGRSREVELGQVLHANARAVSIHESLPTQVSPSGEVKIYAQPGTHVVEIQTLVASSMEELSPPSYDRTNFDAQEIWVWVPDSRLRDVEVSGLKTVDPEHTSLPKAWHGFTTFLGEEGKTLSLTETRRGQPESPPNTLSLSRNLWLDLDGKGYTVQDRLNGTMHQNWRLNFQDEGTLGRVTHSSENNDLLITQDASGDLQGVELRKPSLSLLAESRLEEGFGDLAAVGWDHDVQSLSANLHLPPGWELLGGSGVDEMRGTWIESWTLFDFFFLLMVTLSLGKLCGWKWAPLAALALCLSHGHEDAPHWVWIQLLATLALVRVLPDGWIRKGIIVYRGVALVVLALVLAPYARDQVRFALHPQVDHYGASPTSGGYFGGSYAETQHAKFDDSIPMQNQIPAAPPTEILVDELEEEIAQDFARSKREQASRRGTRKTKKRAWSSSQKEFFAQNLQQMDPNAVVQTGPGVPTWRWTEWRLTWNGPVRKDHRINLWLLSPTWNRVLTLFRVALLVLMALLMITRRDMRWIKKEDPNAARESFWKFLISAVLLGALGVVFVQAAPGEALAQDPEPASALQITPIPDERTLQVLADRMLQSRTCSGPCITASRGDIEIKGAILKMRVEVHAQKDSAWHLPGPVDTLKVDTVRIDGEKTQQFRREGNVTMVRVPEGRHILDISGTLAKRTVLTIQFDPKTKPRFMAFKSEEWNVDGIRENGLSANSLQVTFKDAEEGKKAQNNTETRSELPPWYTVHRKLALGLPWQIYTTIERLDSSRPQLVKVPVLPGEKIISDGIQVENGVALINFPRGTSSINYIGEIPITAEISLQAAKGQPWTENWTVECSRIWRCEFEGIPPVASIRKGAFQPYWKPWPGEELGIYVNRPQGINGQTQTVDKINYKITPGKRLLRATLSLEVRTSQGGWQRITIPSDAELQKVQIKGEDRNIRPQDGVVSVPIQPGKQTLYLEWQQPWERDFLEKFPSIQIGSSGVNAQQNLSLSRDRWLIWTYGPDWGPTVLYWSHLVVLLLISILLGRLKKLPLKTWEWLLLTLGMAQLHVLVLLPIVLWFVVLAWRKYEGDRPWWHFNLLQFTIVGLTVAAMAALYASIHTNLLIDPDMQVLGAGSSNTSLNWYTDRIEGTLPEAGILSVPLLVWRVMMLLWALWLVTRLLKWLPWGWSSFSHEGLWRTVPRRTKTPQPDPKTHKAEEKKEQASPALSLEDPEPPPSQENQEDPPTT